MASTTITSLRPKHMLAAAVCTLPVFPLFWATGHLGETDAYFHAAMLIMTSFLLAGLARWAIVPVLLAVANVPVAIVIAAADIKFDVLWLNAGITFVAMLLAVMIFLFTGWSSGTKKA